MVSSAKRNCQRQPALGLRLGITQRTVIAGFDHSKERYSSRKLIPVNVKTLGDRLRLKRSKADLSQSKVAQKMDVPVRTMSSWEHGGVCPAEYRVGFDTISTRRLTGLSVMS